MIQAPSLCTGLRPSDCCPTVLRCAQFPVALKFTKERESAGQAASATVMTEPIRHKEYPQRKTLRIQPVKAEFHDDGRIVKAVKTFLLSPMLMFFPTGGRRCFCATLSCCYRIPGFDSSQSLIWSR